MNTRAVSSGFSAWLVGPVMKPPSSAISRGRIPSRSSSATVAGSSVFSAGLPICVAAGRIRPRAPRRVCSVTFGELGDVAELVRLAELALADRPRVGIAQRHDPIADRLAGHPLGDLARDLLAALR